MHSQLHDGQYNVGRPLLRYIDKLKDSINSTGMQPNNLKEDVQNHKNWKQFYNDGNNHYIKFRIE